MLSTPRPPNPNQPPRRKPGPKPKAERTGDVRCPEGHEGTINFEQNYRAGPYYTRAGYRCKWFGTDEHGATGWHRHRFTGRSPQEPLTQRHPTCMHPAGEKCPRCEQTYAWNVGLASGHGFIFADMEIAAFEVGVGKGIPVRRQVREMRDKALHFRRKTRSHRGEEPEPPLDEGDIAHLEAMAEHIAQRYNANRVWEMRDDGAYEPAGGIPDEAPEWRDREYDEADAPLDIDALVEAALAEEDTEEEDPEPDPDALPEDPAHDPRRHSWTSGSFAIGAEYIDIFADVCTAPSRRSEWPKIMAVDSLPVRRGRAPDAGGDPSIAEKADYIFEIMGATDADRNHSEVIALYPGGTKDHLSWLEFFDTKSESPEWIVSDLDPAIAKAIDLRFPQATHFRCHDHLEKRLKAAAKADGVAKDSLIWVALARAQSSIELWENFRDLVEKEVPTGRGKLRDWIADNDALIRDQVRLMAMDPNYPRSTGALEGTLVRIRQHFQFRKKTIRNRGRLAKILELMRAQEAGWADEYEYAARIRAELGRLRVSRIGWDGHWDRMVWDRSIGRRVATSSILSYHSFARTRAAQAKIAEQKMLSAQTHQALKAKAAGQMAAAGGVIVPKVGRTTPRGPIAHAGQMCSDVPELMRFWDHKRNAAAGIFPERTAAQSNTEVFWLCEAHLAGDPKGRWPGHPHEWKLSPARRARSGAGCRFCARKEPCPANWLPTTHPHLAAEWDPANPKRADDYTYGSPKTVLWICLIHGSYPMPIRTRTSSGAGCRDCQKAAAKEKKLRTQRETRAEEHRLAKQAKEILELEQPLELPPPPDLGSVDIPDDELF